MKKLWRLRFQRKFEEKWHLVQPNFFASPWTNRVCRQKLSVLEKDLWHVGQDSLFTGFLLLTINKYFVHQLTSTYRCQHFCFTSAAQHFFLNKVSQLLTSYLCRESSCGDSNAPTFQKPFHSQWHHNGKDSHLLTFVAFLLTMTYQFACFTCFTFVYMLILPCDFKWFFSCTLLWHRKEHFGHRYSTEVEFFAFISLAFCNAKFLGLGFGLLGGTHSSSEAMLLLQLFLNLPNKGRKQWETIERLCKNTPPTLIYKRCILKFIFIIDNG